jgi:RND family efflux transporter MFP subunit
MTELNTDLASLRIERAPERPRIGRWVRWVVVLLILAGGGYWGWLYLSRERPVQVEVAAVTERAAGVQAAALNASGYVTPRRRATVSSKMTGKVVEVNVEEGKRVEEGQVLARLDDSSSKAALALAQAQAQSARQAVKENDAHLAQARVSVDRETRLLKAGFGTQVAVDQAQLDLDSTAARIALLQEQVGVADRQVELQKTSLDDTIIRAPFTGIVTTKNAQPGEMVSPVSAGGGFTRTGICTIVDMRSLEIEVDVNESYINRVTSAQGVIAVLKAYKDWQIPAHVITVVPTADRQKATVLVRIGFDKLDPRILPDMGVDVTFLRPAGATDGPVTRAVTLVPKAAVVTVGSETFVFVIAGDTVDRRPVQIAGSDGDRVEVTAGLQSGERVVLTPPSTLKAGAKVTVK